MNQHRERAQRKERDVARVLKQFTPTERAPRKAWPGGNPEDQYPDPPGNDEFDKFDESFRLVVEKRFERGVALTLRRNYAVKCDAARANLEWIRRDNARKAEARRVAQLHLDRLTQEQRQYRKIRSDILDKARRSVRT